MDKEPTITIRGHKFDAYQVDAYWLGMEDERERIIKLLKEQDWLLSIKTHIIELIKGEK